MPPVPTLTPAERATYQRHLARLRGERPLDVTALVGAYERGDALARQWQQRGIMEQAWQCTAMECVLLPGVWEALGDAYQREGRALWHPRPERVVGPPAFPRTAGLPGFVMAGWNGLPSERWDSSHAPGVCYDGVRREVDADLAYNLATLAALLAVPDAEWAQRMDRQRFIDSLAPYRLTIAGLDPA